MIEVKFSRVSSNVVRVDVLREEAGSRTTSVATIFDLGGVGRATGGGRRAERDGFLLSVVSPGG